MSGNYTLLQALLDAGAPLDIADKTGNTPLQLAVKSGAKKCTELLLRHDASITHANLLGETALDIAKNENHQQIVSLIKTYSEKGGILNRLLTK